MFLKFTASSIGELQEEQEGDELLQGVDWSSVVAAVDLGHAMDERLPRGSPSMLRSCIPSSWHLHLLPLGFHEALGAEQGLA